MLETILQPSKHMAPQYTPWQIVTNDGKQLVGLPRRKGGNAEAYLGLDGKEFIVKKPDIEFHREMPKSVMPDGLLQNLGTGLVSLATQPRQRRRRKDITAASEQNRRKAVTQS